MASVFLKIFLRDRQSIFFSLFFPIIFMTVFGFVNDSDQEPIRLGIVNADASTMTADFIDQLRSDPLFELTLDSEPNLRSQLEDGDQTMVLILPSNFEVELNGADSTTLRVLVDAAQVQQLALIIPVLEQKLLAIEREFRGIAPMFSLQVEDVQARSQRYIDFLLPGLLAFTLMQLSIAGSGFNIVEYRRKGILKRLFVTPIKPRDFITAIVLARTVIVLIQLTVLIVFAVTVLDIRIIGSFAAFYLVVLLSTFIFLNLGFCLGSLAKTQQAVMAVGNIVIFPQIFLSGVFYPIESMPEFIQPIAAVLPLSFVASGLRDIANEGASLLAITPSLIGMAAWFVIGFLLATRFFVWKEVAS
jgi:ABC-2 type transport system permease protein